MLAAALAAAPAARSADSACVRFSDGWARLPAAEGMAMTAGFGQLHNRCKAEIAVTSVRSEAFKDVSLHETTLGEDGVSRMREVGQLPLPAGQGAELAPGGLHLMLMHAHAPLQEGQRLPLLLGLSDGTEVRTELVVRQP